MGADLRGVDSLLKTTNRLANRWTGYVRFEVGSGVEYAAVMEFGSKPHIITPDTAPVLHFWVDGVEVFTDLVHHPGTEPRPYMRPAAEEAARNVGAEAKVADDLEELAEALTKIVRNVAKSLAPERTGKLKASITMRRLQ